MRYDDGGKDPVSLGHAECINETRDALQIRRGGEKDLWVPKSVVHDDSEVWDFDVHDEGELVVEQWWVEANGV